MGTLGIEFHGVDTEDEILAVEDSPECAGRLYLSKDGAFYYFDASGDKHMIVGKGGAAAEETDDFLDQWIGSYAVYFGSSFPSGDLFANEDSLQFMVINPSVSTEPIGAILCNKDAAPQLMLSQTSQKVWEGEYAYSLTELTMSKNGTTWRVPLAENSGTTPISKETL